MKPTIIHEPSTLGLRPTFGFGDRIGVATPGHATAVRNTRFSPVFAQQSPRELVRTGRTPEEVLSAARSGVEAVGWCTAWGADADHLKTEADAKAMAEAGFTMFTLDPSDLVAAAADRMGQSELESGLEGMLRQSGFESRKAFEDRYLGQSWNLSPELVMRFMDRLHLYRLAYKFGHAIAHAESLARSIQGVCAGRGFELEFAVDALAEPTSPMEHLFIGLELRRRKVPIVSFAPRFPGVFEKGVDFLGDLDVFERSLIGHAAVARYCGPYKLSVHSGSDKFMIYPLLARHCEGMIHVKTSGTSYLEAMRVIAIAETALFQEIVQCAMARYAEERLSYAVSARIDQVPDPLPLAPGELEIEFLDHAPGRQIMHVSYGAVLSGAQTRSGRPMKDAILEALESHATLYSDLLERHLGRHLQLLEG